MNSKLNFNEHITQKINKFNRIIGLIKIISLILSRNQFLAIYKTLVRSHLHYAEIIYDKPFSNSFREKLEVFQYSLAFNITGVIKFTSRKRLYNKYSSESISDRKFFRKLVFFDKIVKGIASPYLQSYLHPDNERTSNTRSSLRNTIKTFPSQTSTFSATFSYCTKERNQLNNGFMKIECTQKLTETLIKLTSNGNSVFGNSDIYGINLFTHLRLNFSHLNEHNFRHNFNNTINPMCNCGADTERTIHYLLRSQLYSVQPVELFNDIYKLNFRLQNSSEDQLLSVLLYGSENCA